MLGYGGLNQTEGRVSRTAHECETLRAAHARGEVPATVLLGRLTDMVDDLATVKNTAAHPSLTLARESAADLRHRLALWSVDLAPRPLLLPGVMPPPGPRKVPHPAEELPDLWAAHRRDPVRRPAHPDAVGEPAPDGVPLDGEGGNLTDLFRCHWAHAAVALAIDPGVALADIDERADIAVGVLRGFGASPADNAGVRARVLLATGRVEQAREMLDLVGEGNQDPGLAVTRGTVALVRGDLDTLLRVLVHGEDTGQTGSAEWTLLTAASLVPLAHVVDAATTVDRLDRVISEVTGIPGLTTALLHAVEYLALAGQPETALSLLVRVVDPMDVPAVAAPALQAVVAAGGSPGGTVDLGARRLVADGQTLRELADRLAGEMAQRAEAMDRRNGNALWTAVVPTVRECPVPVVDPALLRGIPGLRGLPLPAALPVRQSVTDPPGGVVELPGVGPVDLASLDAEDAICATAIYTLLGRRAAADRMVDRMRTLTATDGDPVVLDVAAEFIRRADCAAGHGAGCFACVHGVGVAATGLLREMDAALRDCACAGTAHDAPARVRDLTRRWSAAHPLVRRLINLDILMSGCLPTRPAVEYAVRGLGAAVRLLPRLVPLTGGILLATVDEAAPRTATSDGSGEPVGRRIVDATVIATVVSVARNLPVPPAASPLGLVDHVADLADLAEALERVGACHEACTVACAGLEAVGGNWVAAGVASGLAPGEVGADDDGPVRLLRARSAALAGLGNTAGAAAVADQAAAAAEYRGRWRLAEDCRVDAAARRG